MQEGRLLLLRSLGQGSYPHASQMLPRIAGIGGVSRSSRHASDDGVRVFPVQVPDPGHREIVVDDVHVARYAVVSVEAEIVRLVAREAILEGARLQTTVEHGECVQSGMAIAVTAGLYGFRRGRLHVGVMTRRADPTVRVRVRHLHQRTHDVTAEAFLPVRKNRSFETGPRGSFTLDRVDRSLEGVARDAMDGEVAHAAELDQVVLVAPRLGARPVHGGKRVDGGRMALDALQPAERGVVRFEVHTVTYRVGDVAPRLRIPFDVAFRTALVRHLSMGLDFPGVLDHGRESHLSSGHQGRLVAGLASETSMSALTELLVGVCHQMARHAEIVVVLYEVVGAVGVVSTRGHATHDDSSESQKERQ
jgi:hypothetical protein